MTTFPPDVLADSSSSNTGSRGQYRPSGRRREPSGLFRPAVATPTDAYVVTDLPADTPLSAILAAEGPLEPVRALDLIAQAARILDASHRQGLVHRNLRPASLMVNVHGRVKVTGFAPPRRPSGNPDTDPTPTSAHYCAPELLGAAQQPSPLSDIYALGVIAYECLAGRRPFEGDDQEMVAAAHLTQEPPPLPGRLSADIRWVIETALQKDPYRRFNSAGQFAEALDDLLAAIEAGDPTDTLTLRLGRTSGWASARTTGPASGAPTGGWASARTTGPATGSTAGGPWRGNPLFDSPAEGNPIFTDGGYPSGSLLAEDYRTDGGAGHGPGRARFGLPQQHSRPVRAGAIVAGAVLVIGGAWATRSAIGAVDHWIHGPAVSNSIAPGPAPDGFSLGNSSATGAQGVRARGGSFGPGLPMVPNEVRKPLAVAEQDLTAAGLNVGAIVLQDSPTVPKGLVLRTSPAAGASVSAGSTVDLFVASGQVQVPDLTGSTLTQALASLRKLGLAARVSARRSPQPSGTVLSQNPKNAEIPQGTMIELMVSSGAAPAPSPSIAEPPPMPSPSVIVSPTPTPSSAASPTAIPAPTPTATLPGNSGFGLGHKP